MRFITVIALLTLSTAVLANGQWENRQGFGYWVVEQWSETNNQRRTL